MNQEVDFKLFEGTTTDIVLPSTKKVTIRESNAADDELLSTLSDVTKGDNIYKFVQSIITHDHDLNRKPLWQDVMGYKMNDIWYLMIRQRIINQGPIVQFEHQADDEVGKKLGMVSYSEDLSPFLVDFNDPSFNNQLIKKYPLGLKPDHEFISSSGLSFKFDILTPVHEKKKLEIPPVKQNMNTPLVIRNLRVLKGGEWVPVVHFGFLPSRIATELRAEVERVDPEFNPIVYFTNELGTQFQAPLFTLTTFFWPKGQM